MGLNINLEGEVAKVVENITHEVKSRAYRASTALRDSALDVLSNKRKRSGKVYRKPFTKKATYTASAPGEAPALRSGSLRMSWRQRTASEGAGKDLTVRPAITTDVKYAPWLDEGTPKMAPRPFKEPIIEHAMPNIRRIFNQPY